MAPGSFLVISHATQDAVSGEEYSAGVSVYEKASAPVVPRRYDEVRMFFDGTDLIAPGLVNICQWRTKRRPMRTLMYGGAGCKRLPVPSQPAGKTAPSGRAPTRKEHAMSNAEPILLDPPDWPGLTNDQLTAFVESVHHLLDSGIFRPPLAAELVRYRDAAAAEISARLAGNLRGPQEQATVTHTISRTIFPL